MSIDYDAQLLDPNYVLMSEGGHGIEARFVSAGGVHCDLVVIDKSRGLELDGGPVLQGARPAACVRVSEIESRRLDREKMLKGRLTFSGRSWHVESTLPKPAPGSKGELILFLLERNNG